MAINEVPQVQRVHLQSLERRAVETLEDIEFHFGRSIVKRVWLKLIGILPSMHIKSTANAGNQHEYIAAITNHVSLNGEKANNKRLKAPCSNGSNNPSGATPYK